MHSHSLDNWTHDHLFDQHRRRSGERATRIVVVLTFTFMAVEIGAGLAFGSMALLADGLHMGSHALALGIAAFAYAYARRFAGDARYSFGTGKVNALGGFAGALLLFLFSGWMAIESLSRAFSPVPIAFDEALVVAVVGLGVNLASAWLLAGGAGHDHHGHDHHAHDHHGHAHHDHGHHDHAHDASHGDLNLRSAYLHVIADALTSVLAILALLGGRQLGWTWLDPVMGLVGAVLVARWAVGLIRTSAGVLLDAQAPENVVEPLRAALEQNGDKLADLHVWRIAPEAYAAIVSIVTNAPASPETYRARIPQGLGIRHASVEVNVCPCGHGG